MSTSQPEGTAANQRHRWSQRRVAAVVAAIAVVAAAGIYLGVRLGSGTGPPTSGLGTVWTRDIDGCPPVSQDVLPWTADGLAVACSGDGTLTAYRVGTGRVAWTWRTPSAADFAGPGTYALIYQTSASTDDGIGVVGYNDDGTEPGPAVLAGIDIASGRQLWRLSGTLTSDDAVNALPGIWASGGRFAAVMFSGSGYALKVYDLATGAPVWSSTSRQIPPAGCNVSGDAISGPSVYVVTSCNGSPSVAPSPDMLYQMSLQTGAVTAQVPLQDRSCQAQGGEPSLWAIGGYVLSGCFAASSGPHVVIIPAGGVRQHVLTWPGNSDSLDALSTSLYPPSIAVSGSTLYVGQEAGLQGNGSQQAEQIAAIDLDTARLRWSKTVPIPGADPNGTYYPVNVIGADSRGVLDVIENVGDDAVGGRSGMTVALLSQSDGTISYGPGTTYSPAAGVQQPLFAVVAGKLLVFGSCPADGCPDHGNGATVTAYGIGSWPT